MNATLLPSCAHRGGQVAADEWICNSPQLIVPLGKVDSATCRDHCPFVARESAAAQLANRGKSVHTSPRTATRALTPARRDSAAEAAARRPEQAPLVSCIMPTADRPEFAALAIHYFLAQEYPQKELVIVDDGRMPLDAALLTDPRIRYVRLSERATTGAKRNLACREARGEIIVQWDDDDWYAPSRLNRQLDPLLAGRAEITAFSDPIIFDLLRLEFWRPASAGSGRPGFANGHLGTMAFKKRVWEKSTCYPDCSQGEDVAFFHPAITAGCRFEPIPADQDFVYVRHSSNVSGQSEFWRTDGTEMLHPPAGLTEAMPRYRQIQAQMAAPRQPPTRANGQSPTLAAGRLSGANRRPAGAMIPRSEQAHQRPLVAIPVPPPLKLKPQRSRAIVTVAAGNNCQALLAISGPFMQAYAERVGADFVVCDWPGATAWPISSKYAAWRAFEHYERIAYVDVDVLLRPDAIDLFDACAADEVGVADELCWHRAQPQSCIERDFCTLRAQMGFPSRPVEWYLNSGVLVAPRSASHMLAPPAELPAYHCAEQDLLNARIQHETAEGRIKFRLLDYRCNWQHWIDPEFQCATPEAVLHFSGMFDFATRLRSMVAWATQ